MKRFLVVISILTLLGMGTGLVRAQTEGPFMQQTLDYFDLPLCLPGMPADGSCLLLGPAQTVAKMKEAGFPYPPRDLPAAPPSAELGRMPILVAKINIPENEPALIYGSFEDAVAGVNPYGQIAPGALRFIHYVDRRDHNGNPYLMLASGGWLRASPAAYTDFQGLQFFENPRNDFGWIIDQTPSYRSPGFDAELTGKNYYREDVIQIFNTTEVNGILWHQIAPDEWINTLKVGVVSINPIPPQGVDNNRWIELDLYQQTLMVYENGKLLFATLMASGLDPFFTQPGLFKIYEKKPLETMRGSFEADGSDFYYLEDVPWTMYFDQARALHTAYWRTYFGYPQSHGCINLSPGDAKWLYDWAEVGDYVWVHDPSGRTPTDPDYYGAGAP